MPQHYYPTAAGRPADLREGNDLQAQWHEQKKKDADFMASQKVISTRNMNSRAFSSHNGYYGMPKPVLGQRQFANPSLGAGGDASARHTSVSAPFHWADANGSMSGMELEGGVLRSKQGQEYGKKVLLSRIAQLNAIDEAKKNFSSGLPAPALSTLDRSASTSRPAEGDATSGDVRETAKIELNNLLRAIDDALIGGEDGRISVSRFTYSDATRMLSLVFRIAPNASEDELSGILGDVENSLEDLLAYSDPDYDGQIKQQDKAVVITLGDIYSRLRDYLKDMIKGVTLSQPERLALSKALVKSYGFSRLARDAPRNVQFAQAREDAEDGENFDDDDDDGDEAPSREDTEQGTQPSSQPPDDDGRPARNRLPVRNPRADLTPDERDAFGYASGTFYPSGGRPAAAYHQEEAPENVGGPGFEALAVGPRGVATREPQPEERRVAESPNVRAAQASALTGLRGRFDPDTQGFNVSVGRRSAAAAPAPAPGGAAAARAASSRRSAAAAPAPAGRGLPTTAAALRDQTRTMDMVRDLVARMNAAGMSHRVRAATVNPEIARKNIAKKLGIKGRV